MMVADESSRRMVDGCNRGLEILYEKMRVAVPRGATGASVLAPSLEPPSVNLSDSIRK